MSLQTVRGGRLKEIALLSIVSALGVSGYLFSYPAQYAEGAFLRDLAAAPLVFVTDIGEAARVALEHAERLRVSGLGETGQFAAAATADVTRTAGDFFSSLWQRFFPQQEAIVLLMATSTLAAPSPRVADVPSPRLAVPPTTITTPVIERIIQTILPQSGSVTQTSLEEQLSVLRAELLAAINNEVRYTAPAQSQSVNLQAFASSQRIDQLSGTDITNPTIIGGTISDTSISAGSLSASGTTTLAGLSLGSISGFLKATAGAVSTALVDLAADVTGILPLANGGTGTSSAPTYGKVLLGNSSGTYDLVATSSLGISSSALPSGTTGQFPYYAADGTTLTATSSVYLATTGNIGIGSSTPTYRLSVEGTSSLGNEARAGYFTATSTTATSTFAGGVGVGTTTPFARFAVQGAGSGTGTLFNLANSAFTTVMNVLDNGMAYVLGNFGIGTSTPWRKLSITDTVSSPQVAIAYDATRYAQLQVDSVGDLTLSAQGGNVYITNENFFACTSGCPAGAPTGTGNLLAENKLGVGTTTPLSKLTIETQDASTDFFQVASSTVQSIFGIFANGRVGIATSTPWKSLSVNGDGVLTGTLYLPSGVASIAPTTCPSGMIPVPGSPADGQPGFCVDKYETQSSSGNAVSVQGGSPWVSLAQTTARAQCIRAGKHLITEKEWLAIAHDVENVGWNWNGGVVGTNQMSDGHSDNSPASALATAADASACSGTGQTCDLSTWDSQRRVYKLSNDQYIWDFGGNVWEWVDQTVQSDYPIVNSAAAGWQACSTSGDGTCGNTRTTNDQWYRGGVSTIIGFLRGGGWDYGAGSGAFALLLDVCSVECEREPWFPLCPVATVAIWYLVS